MSPLVAVMPPSQLVLRALVLLGPVTALLAIGPAGNWPPWWMLLVVLGLATGFAVRPDSPVGAAVILVVVIWWTVSLDDVIQPEVLVAATALVVAHLAALLASYGPSSLAVEPATWWLWVRRGLLVLLTVPATWGLAVLLRGEPEQPYIWILGVLAALTALVVATLVFGPGDGAGP